MHRSRGASASLRRRPEVVSARDAAAPRRSALEHAGPCSRPRAFGGRARLAFQHARVDRGGPQRGSGRAGAAREHLLSLQNEAGWWRGELQTNVTMDAEDLLLREFLGIRGAQETARSAAWIRSQQRADGTWANFFEGPGDLSTTIEAYWALRLAGDDPGEEHMRIAAEFIREQGGIAARARVHAPVARAVRAVVLGPRARAAGRDRAAAGVASRSTSTTSPAGRARRSWRCRSSKRTAPAARCPSTSTSSNRRAPAPAARRARPRASPAAAAAGSRGSTACCGSTNAGRSRRCAGSRSTAPRAGSSPPGGRRLVGRDPAAVGLLPDRAEPVRISARAPGDAPRARGDRDVHGRGPRRPRTASARRTAAAGAWKPASRRSGTRPSRSSR